MLLRVTPLTANLSPSSFLKAAGMAVLVALSLAPLAAKNAKDTGLIAIELYPGPAGPAYVQITSFSIDGKTELRVCGSSPKISRSEYGKLSKVLLSAGVSLEDDSNGVLTLTQGATSYCVVPGNLKLEKNVSLTPAELAARAVLGGTVLPGGHNPVSAPPPFAPGVKIVFVTSPNVEFAEYLRADHSPSIPLWQDYLAKYPASEHAQNAKQSLASLLVKDGENSLDAYRKSLSAAPRSYPDLKTAEQRAEQAIAVVPQSAPALALREHTHDELTKLIAEGQNEIRAYKQALTAHTAGYAHLVAARDLANACTDIDPHFAPVMSFQTEIDGDVDALEASLKTAESLMASQRYDDAFAAVKAYTSFAGEVSRIAVIVNATYQFHLDKGQQAAATKDWETAVVEFRKAAGAKPAPAIAAILKNAEDQLEAAKNEKAADAARALSRTYEQENDSVQAFEVLDNLPPAQRSLVSADIDRLTPGYVKSAPETANVIQEAHEPIRGIADEVEMQRAYGYLQRAYTLSQDPSLKDRTDNLGDKLSEYYLEQAKHYMDKPLGSGAGLGWFFLEKALKYKASNLDAVRDERTKATSAYQMRSRLSIRVVFRDQTSRRDSAGFADQLADAIATGLEASHFPGKVIRPGETPAFDPNFQLVGDVVEHRPTKSSTSQPKDSQYLFSERETPNPEWNKTNREYEAAKEELQTLQEALPGINARGKKKDIAEANAKISLAEKKVDEVHARLDSIPTTTPVDVTKPYTYTEKTFEVSATVQLQFRVSDLSGNPILDTVRVNKEKSRKFQVLENVKPEDTQGVKAQGTEPDETQFLTDVENDARDELIKVILKNVTKLPDIVFKKGRILEEEGDLDGAAASYILYLNSAPESENPEQHRQAERFLLTNYNIRWTVSEPSS